MVRIALVALNARYSHSNPALLYLEKALEIQNNPEIELLELIEWNINGSPRELLEILVNGKFTHIVFSVYIWNSLWLDRFLSDLGKICSRSIIILGGPDAVHRSVHWLKTGTVDYIIRGSAEDFAPVLPDLKEKTVPEILSIDPKPFTETVFPHSPESIEKMEGRLLYYEAGRGCLFHCSYCLSSREDHQPEYRTGEQILDELKLLVKFRGTVKFVDRTFNADSRISRMVWRYIIDNPPAGCFHFEIHPLLLENEDYRILKKIKPGSVQFEIGIQSTDKSILKNVNRKGDWSREKAAVLRLKELGNFHLHLDQIVGLPGDTTETAARSMDEILSLRPDNFQLGFLKILPGTLLSEQKEKWGILPSGTPPYEVLQTGCFSFSEIQEFHRIEKLMDLFYNRGFFRLSLDRIDMITGSLYRFFTSFLSEMNLEIECRRWDYWGEKILLWIDEYYPEERRGIIDLLRLDWCPFAKAQYFPGCIGYSDSKKIMQGRKAAGAYLYRNISGVKKSEINRAILFLPESKLFPLAAGVVFIKTGGILRRIEIPREFVFPGPSSS